MLDTEEKVEGDIDKENLAIIKLINQKLVEDFRKVPYDERVLFLPQCMRNSEKCQAKNTDMGYVCTHCGACGISKIKKEAESLGYQVFIVPGGRMVYKIVKSVRPKALVGVACPFELAEAMEKLSAVGMLGQGILLEKDGCRNTQVNVENTIQLLHLNGHKPGAFPCLAKQKAEAKTQEA